MQPHKLISLPTAKLLHETAKKHGYKLSESEYSFLWCGDAFLVIPQKTNTFSKTMKDRLMPAYDDHELGEMLPATIKIGVGSHNLLIFKIKNMWHVNYEYTPWLDEFINKKSHEAKAAMMIYLIENKLTQPHDSQTNL